MNNMYCIKSTICRLNEDVRIENNICKSYKPAQIGQVNLALIRGMGVVIAQMYHGIAKRNISTQF